MFAATQSASLSALVSDRCQRGPICSLWSQLANSSVCTRFISMLIKARSFVFLQPNATKFFSFPPVVPAGLTRTVSIIRHLARSFASA